MTKIFNFKDRRNTNECSFLDIAYRMFYDIDDEVSNKEYACLFKFYVNIVLKRSKNINPFIFVYMYKYIVLLDNYNELSADKCLLEYFHGSEESVNILKREYNGIVKLYKSLGINESSYLVSDKYINRLMGKNATIIDIKSRITKMYGRK